MQRKVIKIDKEKCNGCGLCVSACHEGAIKMEEGKAYLAREDFCDGLGDCLPACPTGAISFEEREALAFTPPTAKTEIEPTHTGCPGMEVRTFSHDLSDEAKHQAPSRLMQWPCQIKLVPVNAPYFDGANLLVAADCTAYAYGSFHNDFMKNHVTLIGCPKLDAVDYTEKLSAIISANNIKSLKILRMEVPCCSGLENAAKRALKESGKFSPWQVITITTDGRILE